MGRFYKATPGEFIDNKMFKLDPNVMMHATKVVDQNITDVFDSMKDNEELLKADIMNEDDPQVKAKLRAYSDKIGDISEKMNQDILGYKKHGASMRGLSRDISADLNTGLIGTAEKNKVYNKELEDELSKRKDLTQLDIELANKERRKTYQESGGAKNLETGDYQDIRNFDIKTLQGIGDENAYLKDVVGDMKLQKVNMPGLGDSRVQVTEDRIEKYIEQDLEDRNFADYKRQQYTRQHKYGEGFELRKDEKGNELSLEESIELQIQDDITELKEKGVAKYKESRGSRSYAPSRSGGSGSGTPSANTGLVTYEKKDISSAIIGDKAKIGEAVAINEKLSTHFSGNPIAGETPAQKIRREYAGQEAANSYIQGHVNLVNNLQLGNFKGLQAIAKDLRNKGVISHSATANLTTQATNWLNNIVLQNEEKEELGTFSGGANQPQVEQALTRRLSSIDPNRELKSIKLYKNGEEVALVGSKMNLVALQNTNPRLFTANIDPDYAPSKVPLTQNFGGVKAPIIVGTNNPARWNPTKFIDTVENLPDSERNLFPADLSKIKKNAPLDVKQAEALGMDIKMVKSDKEATYSSEGNLITRNNDASVKLVPRTDNNEVQYGEYSYNQVDPIGNVRHNLDFSYSTTVQLTNKNNKEEVEVWTYEIIIDSKDVGIKKIK